MKNFLLFLWQLPQNIIGAIIAIICQLMHCEIDSFSNRVVVSWHLSSGLSLGKFIFVPVAASSTIITHEFGHTLQSEMLGWLYLIVIGIPSFCWACIYNKKMKVSYYSFYTEKWADKLGQVTR